MSNENQNTATVATETVKMTSKLVMKMLGNPKQGAALEQMGDHITLGKIYGICSGIKQKEDAISGKVYFPLFGVFEAHTQKGDKIRAGLLYLPSGIHESYEATARKLEDGETFNFAVEVRSVRSSNAAGYGYEVVDLMPRTVADPLDEFVAKATGTAPVLAAPAPVAALPEPAKTEPAKTHPAPAKSAKK